MADNGDWWLEAAKDGRVPSGRGVGRWCRCRHDTVPLLAKHMTRKVGDGDMNSQRLKFFFFHFFPQGSFSKLQNLHSLTNGVPLTINSSAILA
jgi:hypothetical protein